MAQGSWVIEAYHRQLFQLGALMVNMDSALQRNCDGRE